MKTKIVFRNVRGRASIAAHIERRILFAFSRLKHAIRKISVTVADVNGPRGGEDKLCRIVVEPDGMSAVVVTERQTDLASAINRAADRASNATHRSLGKRKRIKRHESPRRLMPPVAMSLNLDASASN